MAAGRTIALVCALVMSFVAAFALAQVACRQLASARGRGAGWARELAEGISCRMLAVPPVARAVRRGKEARRQALLSQQMPEAIRLLCIALDAGSSLPKALAYAAENTEAPLADELKRTVWDLQAGHGFDEAMVHLRERTGNAEFAYLAVAMEIQHRSGGSLSAVLKTIAGSLRDAAELAEKLKTQTAQGRLSARVVAVMPLAVLGVMSLFAPSYLLAFVSCPLGVFLLVLAVLLEACGVVWVRRVLALDLTRREGR